MNLREMAEKDLAMTLEDSEKGFGVPIKVVDPSGTEADLIGQTGDAHLLLDADTDAKINNRTAHVSLRISSLENAGLGIPKAQPDQSLNPWIFEFEDSSAHLRKFTVSDSMPDRTLGVVTVILELIKE